MVAIDLGIPMTSAKSDDVWEINECELFLFVLRQGLT